MYDLGHCAEAANALLLHARMLECDTPPGDDGGDFAMNLGFDPAKHGDCGHPNALKVGLV